MQQDQHEVRSVRPRLKRTRFVDMCNQYIAFSESAETELNATDRGRVLATCLIAAMNSPVIPETPPALPPPHICCPAEALFAVEHLSSLTRGKATFGLLLGIGLLFLAIVPFLGIQMDIALWVVLGIVGALFIGFIDG